MSSDASKKNRFLMRYKEKSEHNQYWYSTPTIDAMVAATEEKAKKGAFLSTPSIFYSLTSEELRKNSTLFDYDEEHFKRDPNFIKYDFNHPEHIPSSCHHQYDYVVIDPPFITHEVWQKYAVAAQWLLQKPEKGFRKGQECMCATCADISNDNSNGGTPAGNDESVRGDREKATSTAEDKNTEADTAISSTAKLLAMLEQMDVNGAPVFGGGGLKHDSAAARDMGNADPIQVDKPVDKKDAKAIALRSVDLSGGFVLLSTIGENKDMLKMTMNCDPVKFRPSIPNLVYQYNLYTNYPSRALDKLNPEIDDE